MGGKTLYFLDRTWSIEEQNVPKFTTGSWAVNRDLVQGISWNGVLLLPSLVINLAIHHNSNEQSFRSFAFVHTFLEENKLMLSARRIVWLESCLQFFLIGHFTTDKVVVFLNSLSLKFFRELECLKFLLILVIMDTCCHWTIT